MDEFAEAHCKEIHVREWLAGIVPGAGVGTGYSMRAVETAAAASGGDAFATDSLTEDYEFSFRVRELGLKQTFVQLPIMRRVSRRSLWRRELHLVSRRGEPIAQVDVLHRRSHETLVEAADALKGFTANCTEPRPERVRPRRGRAVDEGM